MRKIIDIIPPEEAKESVVFIKQERAQVEQKEKAGGGRIYKKRRARRKLVMWGGLLGSPVLIVLVIFLSLPFFSSLTLTARIAQDTERFEEKIVVQAEGNTDFTERVISGKVFATEEEASASFEATGAALEEGRAGGTLVVYNNHTPVRSLTFRDGTRFLSAKDGKIFKAQDKVYLPAARVEGGKLIPGTVEVFVKAAEAGEDYNIPPSKFSVPGLSGTAFYYTVWAESTEAMEGGFKEEAKKITEQDLEQARLSVKEKLLKEVVDSLNDNMPEGFVFDRNGFLEEEFDIECSREAGAVVPKFDCRGSIKASTVAFPVSDLTDFTKKLISSRLSSSAALIEDKIRLDFLSEAAMKDEQKMILSLQVEFQTYQAVEEDKLLAVIAGKKQTEIEQAVSQRYPQIRELEFNFWPFWVKKAPSNKERITLELTFTD